MKRLLRCIAVVALLLPLQLNAQPVWTAPSRSDGITLEGYKPNFDEAFDTVLESSFPTSAWFLAGHYSVIPSLRLGAEIGLSHFGLEDEIPGFAASESALGNLRLSAECMTPVENLSAVLALAFRRPMTISAA